MSKEKIEIITRVGKDENVEEKAYLLVTNGVIGVTDSLEDVYTYMKKQEQDGEIIRILPGYKKQLLILEQRILLQDEIYSSLNSNTITIPQLFTDYNLIQRCKDNECSLLEDLNKNNNF